MSKFNTNKPSSKTSNLAGGVAFKMSPEMELTHAVLTTFLEDKYYESGEDRMERIRKLMALAGPEFSAKLAVVARKEFYLRSVSHLLIGELAKLHKGDDLVKNTIIASAIRPDDLTEILSYVGTPVPKQVKRGIRNALFKFDRYQLAKYKGEGKGYSMVDLFNLVHPKAQFANEEQKKAWKDLMEGNLTSFDTWETEISNAKDEKAKVKAWQKLVLENKLGYMALLRNLNNIIKYEDGIGIAAIDKAIEKLTNKEEVLKSKQLPFRFVTAYRNVKGNRRITDAISIAMDYAVSNTPELKGNTLIAVDCSGSMGGGENSAMSKASIFGATLIKANVNADLILYDDSVYEITVGTRMPVIDIAEKIEKAARGGGTETSLVFKYAMKQEKKYQRIIIISDNESWREGYHRSSVQDEYNTYKKIADPFVYAIDIEGYGTTDISSSKVKHLTGWSNRLLDFIGAIEKGETLVDYIKSIKI